MDAARIVAYFVQASPTAHGAIQQVKTILKSGYRIAVDLDLEKFFDTVNHDVLMSRIARKVADKVLLRLIGRYLRAGVLVGSTVEPTEWGTPQGSPLSPLFSNVLLDDLDKELEARGHRFVRYVDDLVILVKSRRAGQRVMVKISRYLTQVLKLKVNWEKSRVVKIEDLNYLGFTFRGIRIFASDTAMQALKHRWRSLPQAYARLNVTQLGRLNGRTIRAIEPIFARVDELLWHFPALHPNRRVRWLVKAADNASQR